MNGPGPTIKIADRRVGAGAPCLVIAEVAQAHDGSLGQAHAFIDAVAKTGADAVKFQTHIAAAESTPLEPWRVKFSPQDETRWAYWKRMEFAQPQWQGLKQHAEQRGLIFLSSPFSSEAVDLLERIGVPAWKVASGEIENPLLLERMASKGNPVLLSSGMSSLQELDRAVELIRNRHAPLAVLQCTTEYPCRPERLGLDWIQRLRQRYHCPTGLSDHSGTIFAGLAAVTLGASILEVHVTLSREMFGPDVVASVTTSELKQLVDGLRFVETAMSCAVDKDLLSREMSGLRATFGKSVVARVDLPAGTLLKKCHLTVKKPGTGTPAFRLAEFVGRRLSQPVQADQLLTEDLLAN